MTKAEFDRQYKNCQIAVHMPGLHEADYLLNYVNQLCGTAYTINWSIEEFPYLFHISKGKQSGWTGTGIYNNTFQKIAFDEFYAAVNGVNDIVDVDFGDMTDMI